MQIIGSILQVRLAQLLKNEVKRNDMIDHAKKTFSIVERICG